MLEIPVGIAVMTNNATQVLNDAKGWSVTPLTRRRYISQDTKRSSLGDSFRKAHVSLSVKRLSFDLMQEMG